MGGKKLLFRNDTLPNACNDRLHRIGKNMRIVLKIITDYYHVNAGGKRSTEGLAKA